MLSVTRLQTVQLLLVQCDVIIYRRGTVFCFDVVLRGINNIFRDEVSFLEYEKQICFDFYYDNFFFYNNISNPCKHKISTQTQFYELLVVEWFLS